MQAPQRRRRAPRTPGHSLAANKASLMQNRGVTTSMSNWRLSRMKVRSKVLPSELPTAHTTATSGEVKFGEDTGFHQELRKRVRQHFLMSGQRQRDCPRMYVKTGIVLGWFLISYFSLVFFPVAWWLSVPIAISLGLSMAAVGFNVQHDGGHGAYSARAWVNGLMAMSLDLLGGSSYIWARKHNKIHHSYTNITGHDDDINVGFVGRLSPHQKRLRFHRMQHYYLWFLYGLLPTKWQMYDDFRDVITGRIGVRRFERPKAWKLVIFFGGKIAFFSLAFLIPMLLHPAWAVLLLYAVASFVQGLALSVVFQSAHCVEETSFPLPKNGTRRMKAAWAVHQVETTVNFACGSRLLSWLIGGLNFQIEHHLFPRICHVHYPALSRLVRETCETHGVRYTAHDSFWGVVASHFRWLRRMGAASSV